MRTKRRAARHCRCVRGLLLAPSACSVGPSVWPALGNVHRLLENPSVRLHQRFVSGLLCTSTVVHILMHAVRSGRVLADRVCPTRRYTAIASTTASPATGGP